MRMLKIKSGFTLIELLVVIGILAVLAAIAIPSVAGLIDRANQSADLKNAKAMTNAIEQFTSEYELVKQDIASNKLDIENLDSVQGRVFNIFEINEQRQIAHLENNDGYNGYGIDIDTKYPVNEKTFKSVILNYLKTSSSTFIPKQSDKAFYYSPEIGVVIVATEGSTTEELNGVAMVDEDGISLNNLKSHISLNNEISLLADNNDDNNIQWINITLNTLNEQNNTYTTNLNVASSQNNIYTTLRTALGGYMEYENLSGGLFVEGTNTHIKINVNGEQVDATWKNLIAGEYISVANYCLENGPNAYLMSGEMVIGGEISTILSHAWDSENSFLSGTNVTSVILCEGIKEVGSSAFHNAENLKSISLPSTVEKIDGFFAADASNLKSITVSNDSPYFKSVDGILYSKDMKKIVRYPLGKTETEFYIPDTVETIGKTAFKGRKENLKIVHFGQNVKTVEQMAFEGRGLEKIYINKDANLDEWAIFRDNRNVYFYIESGSNYMVVDNVIYTANGETLIANGYQDDMTIQTLKTVKNIKLLVCGSFETLILPKSVTQIKNHTIPYHLKNIIYEGTEEEFNRIQMPSESNDSYKYISQANITYGYTIEY